MHVDVMDGHFVPNISIGIPVVDALRKITKLPLDVHLMITDPDKYKVIFENEHIRLLDYKDKPGEKTNQHEHPAFALYALSPFKRNIHLEDGKIIEREFKTGEIIWSEGQIHVGENVGDMDTHALIIELKNISE